MPNLTKLGSLRFKIDLLYFKKWQSKFINRSFEKGLEIFGRLAELKFFLNFLFELVAQGNYVAL